MQPDLILHNATIATCDAGDCVASALAIWRDRICAVGADEDVLGLAGGGTRVIDLDGRFVCPGFIDCHVHISSWALVASGRRIDLEGSETLSEALQRVREGLRLTPLGGWLQGRGWDKNQWPEGRFPAAADLDAVTGETPTALRSHDGHSLWVNSAAMKLAGIPDRIDDPPGGRILRDDAGRSSGVFQESASGLVQEHVPAPTLREITDALGEALPKASALGLTGAHNCEGADALRALQRLRDDGELTLRVTQYPPAGSLEHVAELGLTSGFGDEWLRIGGLKAFLDGALGAQTAAMLEPYEGSENAGVLTMSPEELQELALRATRAGMPLALHAIGDRAVRIALDAFQAARRDCDSPWPRHRLEHAQHVHPGDIARCAELGIIASVQPAHMLADIDICELRLGARSRWAFPLRSLLSGGVRLAFGSDAPVETMDPLAGFRSALARQRRNGTPPEGWHPQEKLTPTQALRAYTTDAALAAGEETIKGSLEAGKLADFIMLSEDILCLPIEGLAEVEVVATVVGGRPTHDPDGVLS